MGIKLGFSVHVSDALITRPNYLHVHIGENSGPVFPVDGLQNSGRIQLLKLLEFSSPSTGQIPVKLKFNKLQCVGSNSGLLRTVPTH